MYRERVFARLRWSNKKFSISSQSERCCQVNRIAHRQWEHISSSSKEKNRELNVRKTRNWKSFLFKPPIIDSPFRLTSTSSSNHCRWRNIMESKIKLCLIFLFFSLTNCKLREFVKWRNINYINLPSKWRKFCSAAKNLLEFDVKNVDGNKMNFWWMKIPQNLLGRVMKKKEQKRAFELLWVVMAEHDVKYRKKT